MKILVISLAGVGDTIMGSQIIKAIKEEYKHADLLCFPYGVEELYKNYIDNIFVFNDFTHTKTSKKSSIFQVIKTFFMLLKLRKNKYDLSISLYPSSSKRLAFLARVIHAKKRIGFEHPYYTDPVPLNTNIHRFERNLDLIKVLNIKIENPKQFIPLTKENEEFAEEVLKDKGNLFIGFHVGGYWKGTNTKKWPIENFAKLADLLNKNFGARIIVFEGPSDEGDGKRMKSLMKESQPIIINTNLKNVAALMKKTALLVSNDTGIMHLAEAVETPVIDLGGWVEPEDGPYLKTNKLFISKDLPCYVDCWIRKTGGKEGLKCNLECYKAIKVGDVYKEAEKMLKK